ncbi:MAG: hypothetical protein JNK60_03820 [Acidobacteria bacterium]|nr:hypothetical protein [Acidobacteriota bacterium]
MSDIALDPSNPYRYFVGFASGGVWRTSNNGASFSPVFDKESTLAIGALAVSPANPKIVWAGTGEASDRNSASFGEGVFVSTDGGDSWKSCGLAKSRTIARIVAHPTDPKTAYVAATGDLWQPGGERGLYKTTDGGGSWKAVLRGAAPFQDQLGAGDLALDPKTPETVYAVLYARQRTPYSFRAGWEVTGGKDAGGIFKSTDGGGTWKKLEKGLPSRLARIGLDVSRSSPNVVLAIVQSDEGGAQPLRELRSRAGGVFRSEDGGETFTRTNPLNPRPFYYSQIRVDPFDDARVYVLGMSLHVSEDGGRTFREDLFEKVHPDNHALALGTEDAARTPRETPKEGEPQKAPFSRRLLIGTDGGLFQSFDGGRTWDGLNKMPVGQFYRASVDGSKPYRICGGLQDNQNWVGPSRRSSKDGIRNADWISAGGGDGFDCAFSDVDPDEIFTESQQGTLYRLNLRTGESKSLRPEPAEGQSRFRFHWNAPLFGSRHEKGVLYFAGNRVFRLTERGERWETISPDLSASAKDPERTDTVGSGAENHGVVYTLAESPRQKGLLWAGTDDGKLWLTANGGESWTDLSGGLPAPAKGQWISRVVPGAHDAAHAYLVVSAFRSGNHAPLVYVTEDAGKTWKSIAGNLPDGVPAKTLAESPLRPSVLFVGTEAGLFVTVDRGLTYTRIPGIPRVPVDDLVIHPDERDLVVATHGRSLYVLDDAAPLLSFPPSQTAAHLFPPREATAAYLLPGSGEWTGKGEFRGENPPEGAPLTFWLAERTGDDVKIAIRNAAGQTVANLKAPSVPGFSRVWWDLRPTKDVLAEYGSEGREKFVRPGDYTVTLTSGSSTSKQTLKVSVLPGIETR